MSKELQTNTFKTPFSAEYWHEAFSELKSIKKLTIAALFIAITLVVRSFFIPIPVLGGQRIYFTFFVKALGTIIYGPILGAITGAMSDYIGAMLFPTGAFFIGYTITSAVSSFLYGIFLYKTKLTITKIFLSKLSVNLIGNVLLNSLWSVILMGNGFWVIALARLPKNLILLPIETFIMYIVFKIMIPIMKQEKVIDYSPIQDKIKWF